MYAVVRRYQFPDGNVEDMLEQVHANLLPILCRSPGVVAYYAVNGGGGMVEAVSLFTDRASAEVAAQVAAGWLEHQPPQALVAPVQVTEGEVVLRR